MSLRKRERSNFEKLRKGEATINKMRNLKEQSFSHLFSLLLSNPV